MSYLKDVNFFSPKSKPIITDVEVVQQEIALLINTEPTEIPFDRSYGIDIEQPIFEFITASNATALYFEIVGKVQKFIKAVVVDEQKSRVYVNSDETGYILELYYKLKNTPSSGNSFKLTKEIKPNV